MPPQPQHIAKNTTYLTAALIIQKTLSLAFFLLLARVLGGAKTGDYVAAFSMSSIFGVFIDLGLGSVLIRELARNPAKSRDYLGNTVSIKLILSLVAYAALLSFVKLLDLVHAGHPPIALVAIAGAVMVADSFTLAGTSVFRGWQNLWFESVIIALNKVVVLGLGAIVLFFAPSTFNVMLTILAGSLTSIVLLSYYLYQNLNLSWRPRLNHDVIRELVALSTPFALAGIFSAFYAYSDSVLLSIFKGSQAVGLYSLASKTMNAFQFIPSAFMAAVYPAMSSYYQYAQQKLQLVLEESLRYLLIISVPVAVGLYLLAGQFVERVGPDYRPAAAAVKMLVPSLIFVFLSFPIGALLNASNRQHWQTSVIGGGMAVNIALNLWLIPRWSYLGASASWFVTNACVLIISLWLARLVVRYSLIRFTWSVLRTAAAATVMSLVTTSLVARFPLAIVVLVSAVAYGLTLFATQELTRNDLVYFYGLFRVHQPLPPEQALRVEV